MLVSYIRNFCARNGSFSSTWCSSFFLCLFKGPVHLEKTLWKSYIFEKCMENGAFFVFTACKNNSGMSVHCIHIFVVIHKIQKSPTSNAIFSATIINLEITYTFRLKNSTLFKKFVYYNENMNNYLENYNDSEYAIKTKKCSIFHELSE